MTPFDTIIDGTYTLAETSSAIRFKEAGGFQLTSLSAGMNRITAQAADSPMNYASFSFLEPPGTQPKKLELAEVKDSDAGKIIGDRITAGWKLISMNPVFVKGKEKMVAAFRKV